jgi:hypothetical protein
MELSRGENQKLFSRERVLAHSALENINHLRELIALLRQMNTEPLTRMDGLLSEIKQHTWASRIESNTKDS